jgi:hypothetical protein
MQPPASRFQADVGVGRSAVGTAVWMVDAFGLQKGDVRRVTVPVLEASVGYLVL